MDASQFVARWQPVQLTERSAYQQHFLDLCELVGHKRPVELDPKGDFFTFERGVTKQTGGKGWADVWKKGFFAIEYKGRHKDLEAAYDQLLLYRGNLENPPLLVVCDMDRIIIRTNFTGTVEKKHEIPLARLPDPKNLDIISWLFHDPEKLKPEITREAITVRVAKRLGDIAFEMRSRGLHAHGVARFLDRIVFCLFSEDVGLLPSEMFSRLVDSSQNDPKKFFAFVGQLFNAMATGGTFGFDSIRHFNGNLFDSTAVVLPTMAEISRIKDAAKLDWDQVDPSIFGTLFERGMDPDKRSQLGAHYTSREDIESVVDPVIMQPLRREWAAVRDEVERKLAAGASPAPKRTARKTRSTKEDLSPGGLILQFLHRLHSVRILDPACGSGNFLYVALQKLKDLEKEVLVFALDKGLGNFLPLVGPWQLYGIEKSEYAFELAQVSIWIGHIQWQRANGYRTFNEPILQRMTNFQCKDSIVDLSDPDSPVEPDWPEAEFIVGNPPFLGGKKLKRELTDEYVKKLFSVWKHRVRGEADLCCYWFEKARKQIELGKTQRAGLLATQGIRGGANRESLKRIKDSGDIFFGVSDQEWILEGAAVHVSMVGFDNGTESTRVLDGSPVEWINPDLTTGPDVTTAKRLSENVNRAFMGDTKGGKFDITQSEALELLRAPTPGGRPSSDVVTPWINGKDITGRNRKVWVVDYGVGTSEGDAALYGDTFEFLKNRVQAARKNSRSTVRSWWLHERPRVEMRAALRNLDRFIVSPRVAKHRFFVWCEFPTLPDCQLFVFAYSDDYALGLLHSRPHEVWARAQGTQVRDRQSGFRYTPTTCFETFPFPEATEEHRRKVSDAARKLNEYRNNWLNDAQMMRTEELRFPGSVNGPWGRYVRDANEQGIGTVVFGRQIARDSVAAKLLSKRTLTHLYNARPTWLDLAHRELDEAVCAAYGWDASIKDIGILEELLSLNLQREAAQREAAEEADDEELEELDDEE
jgi:hypothetical protein